MQPNSHRSSAVILALAIVTAGVYSHSANAQTILLPWGNLAGMRVSGEPVAFEAGLRMVHPEWRGFSAAVKYLQRPRYSRTGGHGVVESEIEGIAFKEIVQDTGPGEATMALELASNTNSALAGAYFCVHLPDTEFGGGTLELIQTGTSIQTPLTLSRTPLSSRPEHLRQTATGVRITASQRQLEIRWNGPMTVLVRREVSDRPTSLNDPSIRQQFLTSSPAAPPAGYQVYLELFAGHATPGRTAKVSLTLAARAAPDPQPVKLVLDVTKPGRPFDGIGGNFRLQFPKTDAAVLQHNLEHLRVAWSRNDLPWAEWDPDEQADPLAVARSGQLHQKVTGALETARTLARRRIPLIVSAWSPPKWARAVSQPAGLRGTALHPDKMDRISSSLASYLVFVKEYSGVEAIYFSFNEPETGVEVRQTAAEHAQFIKLMGAELIRRGLTTRLLLGDTAHGTPAALDFIQPALADPATHRYVGAIALHTWRGCTVESLPGWTEAARQLGVPLLVTESGPDAHMHEYPSVRLEPWFQLQEIDLYVRICAFGQPATIMEWQFTTDYSILTGADIYGEPGPLKPTQRFWNLKQLGATPAGAFALPMTVDKPAITCAAFGDLANGHYAVHIVNNGAQRPAILAGLPQAMTALRCFITDANRGMEESGRVHVHGGQAEFMLPTASYLTLMNSSAP